MQRSEFKLLQEVYENLYTEGSVYEDVLAKYEHLSDEEMLPIPEEPELYFDMDYPNLVMMNINNVIIKMFKCIYYDLTKWGFVLVYGCELASSFYIRIRFSKLSI